MNKEQYLKEIQESPLSDETKKKIEAILASAETLSIDVMAKVRDLVQAEIDADFAELGVTIDDNDPEAKAALATLEAGLAETEKELAEDMKFVDEKVKDIDALRTQLSTYLDEADVADIRAKLQS